METEKSKEYNELNRNGSESKESPLKEKFSTKKYPNTDFIDRVLRLVITIVAAGFTSGLIAGLIEGITEFDLSFGSPVSIGLFAVLFISFWTLFSNVGRFKNK